MAAFTGAVWAAGNFPFSIWYYHATKYDKYAVNPMQYLFSYISGIFFGSLGWVFVYIIYKKNSPIVFNESIGPAFIGGLIWGVAQTTWIIAQGILGYEIGYPLIVVGPTLVQATWSILVFREIKGYKNLGLTFLGMSLNITCVLLIAFSA